METFELQRPVRDNFDAVPECGPISDTGSMFLIGGREDKEGDREILKEIVRRAAGGRILVLTLASEIPDEVFADYQRAFEGADVQLEHVDMRFRSEAAEPRFIDRLREATVVFFSGGDQARITTKIGGTLFCDALRDFYQGGGIIAGTSSGASVMSDTMVASGAADESYRIKTSLMMAPGLGFIRGMIVDQHFAERGRVGRLLGAIAHNPRVLGVGIDENTAVLLENRRMRVIGEGAVYLADARGMSYTNISEADPEKTMSAFNIRLHVLSAGDEFCLVKREPVLPK